MNILFTEGNRKRAGFSMIEMLVASTILVVIVMLLGMLFQQTSLAWRTGVRRANSFMQVRSLVGSIQRDVSAAIDARTIPEELKSTLGGAAQKFNGWPLQFYTLNVSGFKNNSPGGVPLRALSYITYSQEGKRTETVLCGDGNADDPRNSDVKKIVVNPIGLTTTLSEVKPEFGDLPTDGLPLFLTFTVDVEIAGKSHDIGAASAGPDKVWGTKDDIRTWVED